MTAAKPRYPRAVAIAVAKELYPYLDPVTERLVCAGSLRRGRADVGDLELLFVPRFEIQPDGLFDTRKVDLADRAINQLVAKGILAKRPNVNGYFAWGEKNKLAVHVSSRLPVDLFATTLKQWYVALVVRTGPAELNVRLCESAIKRGLRFHAYGDGFTDRQGNVIPCHSEEDVFRIAGLPYLEPKDRRV